MPAFREIPHRSEDYASAVVLRDRILRAPLGLALTEDELDAEANDRHLGAFDVDSGELLACLVRSPAVGGTFKMRQVAVEDSRRGQGIGSRLIDYAERTARAQDRARLTLHVDVANPGAQRLYERHGFTAEATSPRAHVVAGGRVRFMVKTLD